MDENLDSKFPRKNRAIIVRCDDIQYQNLLNFLSDRRLYTIIFTKTSNLKLYVSEEGF